MNTSIQEAFTEAERRRLIHVVIGAMPPYKRDPELLSILSKMSGTETTLVALRAKPSQPVINYLPSSSSDCPKGASNDV